MNNRNGVAVNRREFVGDAGIDSIAAKARNPTGSRTPQRYTMADVVIDSEQDDEQEKL
jgi:hypothetical protein